MSRSMMDFDILEQVQEESKSGDKASEWEERNNSKRQRWDHAFGSDKDAVVSPYAIRNLTETEIIIQKQLTDEEIKRKLDHDYNR